MKPTKILIGLAFVILGVLFFIDAFVAKFDVMLYLVNFWPALLILLGVFVMTKHRPILSVVAIAVTALILAGVLTKYGHVKFKAIDFGDITQFQNYSAVNAKINFGGGKLNLEGTSDKVLSISGKDYNYEGRKLNIIESQNKAFIDLSPASNFITTSREWDVKIYKNIPLELTIHSGGAKNYINLKDINLKSADLIFGAADSEIYFGKYMGKIDVKINTGVSSLKIHLNKDEKLKIKANILGSHDLENLGLKKLENHTWTSPDLSEENNYLNLDLNAGLASVQFIYE